MSREVVALYGGPLDGTLARPTAEGVKESTPFVVEGVRYQPTDRRDPKGRRVFQYQPPVSA